MINIIDLAGMFEPGPGMLMGMQWQTSGVYPNPSAIPRPYTLTQSLLDFDTLTPCRWGIP